MNPSPIAAFTDTIAATIRDHNMITRKDRVLAAVSGGPDSVALVRALLTLAESLDISLGIAHVNHMLRGKNAEADEAFVRKVAGQWDLPFYCRRINVRDIAENRRLSLEEAGRESRYAFFSSLADSHGYTKVATGHTRDDNAELVLMNLLRGTGPQGLSGIPPVRAGCFIRPLIRASKAEILGWLEHLNQPHRTDESNTDETFLRNRIRCRLIPMLKAAYNPSIIDGLDRLSRISRRENAFLAARADEAFQSCLDRAGETEVTLRRDIWAGIDPALQPRVLRKAIRYVKKDLKRIAHVHMQQIIQLCRRPSPGKHLDLPGSIRIYISEKTLLIKKENLPLRILGKQEKSAGNSRLSRD